MRMTIRLIPDILAVFGRMIYCWMHFQRVPGIKAAEKIDIWRGYTGWRYFSCNKASGFRKNFNSKCKYNERCKWEQLSSRDKNVVWVRIGCRLSTIRSIGDEKNIIRLPWQYLPVDDPQGKCHLLLAYAGEAREVADPWYTGKGMAFPTCVRSYVTWILPLIVLVIFVNGYYALFFSK